MGKETNLDSLKGFLRFHSIDIPSRGSHIGRIFTKRFPEIARISNPDGLPWVESRVHRLAEYVADLDPSGYSPIVDAKEAKKPEAGFSSKKHAKKYESALRDYWMSAGVQNLFTGRKTTMWKRYLINIFSQCPEAAQKAGFIGGRISFEHLDNLWSEMEKRIPESWVIREKRTRRQVPYTQKRSNSSTKEAFYKSWEWRRLRMEVLKEQGAKCSCCGATRDTKDASGDSVRIVVDHIKPLSRHWNLRLNKSNLQVLCDECNMGKGAWDETNWRSQQSAA